MILAGFNRHYALFRYGAQRAKALFESGDWHGIAQLSRERIEYYDMRVRECINLVQKALRHATQDVAVGADTVMQPAERAFWQAIKTEYVQLLADHRQPECAETFFNSVSCRVLHRDYFHNDFLFVRPAVATDYLDSERPVYRSYYPSRDGLRKTLIRLVADFGLATPFEDLPRDARLVARLAVRHLNRLIPRASGNRVAPDCQINVLGTLFFRNKGAYIVGRLVNLGSVFPFAIPLVRTPAGQVRLDALLRDEDDAWRCQYCDETGGEPLDLEGRPMSRWYNGEEGDPGCDGFDGCTLCDPRKAALKREAAEIAAFYGNGNGDVGF